MAIGAATDPYQPAEGRYRLTRACLEVLAAASNPFSIITRGPMIVRDVDVLARRRGEREVGSTFSIPTLDERGLAADRAVDGAPASASARAARARGRRRRCARRDGADPARALRPARAARGVVRAAREAGATGIWANLLFLKPGTREHFLEASRATGPSSCRATRSSTRTAARTSRRRRRSPYVREVARLAREHGIRDRRPVRLEPPPEPEQLALTL